MKTTNFISFILFIFLLSACGGGSDAPRNASPTANAGVDQTVNESTSVTVNGSGTDSDGTVASFSWSQTSGPAVTLSSNNTATATFTAPATTSTVQIVLTLTVTDDDGATGSDSVTITVNTTNQAPTANAGADQTVLEQSTVNLTGSGTDSDGSIASFAWSQVSGSTVTINGAATANASFLAPALSMSEDIVIRLTVTDDRGVTATDDVTITVNADPALNIAPTANAGADQTVAGNSSVTLDGSASSDPDGSISAYAWTQTAGATVTLTNANSVAASFTAPDPAANETFTFQLMVTDNEGATATDTVTITVTPAPSGVTISGKVTYDNVPHNANNSLNYAGTTQDPVRGATIQLLEGSTVLASAVLDDNGDYSFTADVNKTLRIRVRAELKQTGAQSWDVDIIDNTNSGALYVLDSADISTGTSNQVVNLNAASGWGGSSYTSTRAAAPFHILDRVYEVITRLRVIDPALTLSPLNINWSINNIAQAGDRALGQITTSFYSNDEIFLLGHADNDTDEYDGHVIIHEWAHYFEDNGSRSDSIGGSHTGSDRLDMRVAFGEGFGNAWSGMITDDSFYRDSFGAAQGNGFSINVEQNSNTNEGWYNEGSVQSIVYDAYDSVSDGVDNVSLGLTPIYNVLIGQQKNTEAFTSIFSFMTYLKNENAASAAQLDALLTEQSITTQVDIWGTNAANSVGGTSNVLPIYTNILPGQTQQVCTLTTWGTPNKLSNRRYLRAQITTAGSYTVTFTGTTTLDVDGIVFEQGNVAGFDTAGGTAPASVTVNLQIGDAVIETLAYSGSNLVAGCIDVQLTQN